MTRAMILLIDPSRETREMYGKYFRHHGHPVLEAADAPEAARLASDAPPDLVVTELSETREWVEAIAALRKSGTAHETALIVCSTRLDPKWPYAPINVDADVSLPKPASPAELLEAVHQLLARRGWTEGTSSRAPAGRARPSARPRVDATSGSRLAFGT